MATTEVLLLQPVENLGGEGDKVTVKAGYARNYLLPRKLALPITQANRKYVDSLQARRAQREARELASAEAVKAKIEAIKLVFMVKTGDEDRMFGSVTAADLIERFKSEGVELEKKQLSLYTPVKALGKHTTRIKLHKDLTLEYEFEVKSENQPEVVEEVQA
jgi:large subunit ribosomal protein L9